MILNKSIHFLIINYVSINYLEKDFFMSLTLGSLFDGSGGFPLGGVMAGIKPLWASEIEPFPIRVTTKRFPNMKHYGDVSAINGFSISPVDIITFGSPCQDLSIAGKREGIEGARSGLFYQAVRIIKEMREATNGKYPRYIVWENVPGAFSSNKGEDFGCVLDEICSIGSTEDIHIARPKMTRRCFSRRLSVYALTSHIPCFQKIRKADSTKPILQGLLTLAV